MSTELTTREDADAIRQALVSFLDGMEQRGFSRGAVGAAMLGYGTGVVRQHRGMAWALECLDMTKAAIGTRQ